LLRILYDTGLARGIRYPEKFAALGVVALTFFAAYVADRLISGDAVARRAAMISASFALVASTIPFVWSFLPRYSESFLGFWHLPEFQGRLAPIARTHWVIGFATAVAAMLIIVLLPRMQMRAWLGVALSFILVDLLLLGHYLVTTMPGSYFTAPDVSALLDPDRDAYAVMNRGEWTNEDDNYHRMRGAYGPWFARNSLQPFTPAAWGLRTALEIDFDETALLPTHDLLDALMKLGNARYTRWAESMAAISNVRYLVDLRSAEQVVAANAPPPRARLVRLTKLPSTGRYYVPANVIRANTTDAILAAIQGGALTRPTAFVGFDAPTGNARITNIVERHNSASMDVDATSESLVVMTVTRDRYWRAAVDGSPADLHPVNIAYMGVVVPAGWHRVEMHYRNPLVIAGATTSAATVAACAIALVTAPIRRRRRLRSGP
jgi:hypothetical protein